jgi:hypothetical protein
MVIKGPDIVSSKQGPADMLQTLADTEGPSKLPSSDRERQSRAVTSPFSVIIYLQKLI